MKHILLVSLGIIVGISNAIGQQKHDYNWLMGAPPNDSIEKVGGTHINFNFTPPTLSFFNIPFGFLANSSVSDAEGNLLFYSNGCYVANRQHQIMPNGDSLNYGLYYSDFCADGNSGYPAHQGILTLPWPDDPERYAILHYRTGDTGNGIHAELLYSLVDMTLDKGLGDVTLKNQLLAQAFYSSTLTAVRHGNGRDWWIVAPIYHTKLYYTFLFSPEGFSGPYLHSFGQIWTFFQGGSQDCFSTDGSKFIRMAPGLWGCQITDFDRCTGQFGNVVNLYFPGDTIQSNGCAVSPNNRYLYVSAYTKLYQFDLEADDISASRILIDQYDGYLAPFPTRFFQAMPAPDGKIYLSVPNGVRAWHVIHNPNEPGLACNFEQHGVELPTHVLFPIPNFPNFRLYDLPGSPCDTLGIDAPTSQSTAPVKSYGPPRLMPNPVVAGDPLRIEAGDLFEADDQMVVLDAMGRLCRRVGLPQGVSHVYAETTGLPPGIYWVALWRGNGGRQVEKFVVVRE